MAGPLRILSLLVVNVLIPVSYLLFAKGFFPYKPFLTGLATYPDEIKDAIPPPIFDKVVFMLVDALRSDFVYSSSSGFKFVQSLIDDGAAIPFTAHATSPTVTQPRLKAITTGSIPSFLDMVLNIDESDKSSNLAKQDTWLTQMRATRPGKQVMYGDDTWLKLFPDHFDRSDGTTSFFVADFTIVDNNVTRHVTQELKETDWNVWILHYLGVDHIGHKSGAASQNMVPKQREMDAVVQDVYTAIETQSHLKSTLFVLCGDHGMTDAGNHGGSAPGETSAALTFISPKFKELQRQSRAPIEPRQDYEYYDKVEQSDIAPTLAALLGFPVPQNNLGVMISDFLPLWSSEHQGRLALANALQILNIVQQTFPHLYYANPSSDINCQQPPSTSDELACLWRDVNHVDTQRSSSLLLDSAYKFCRTAQKHLSSTASNYNITWLLIGVLVASLSVILTFFSAMHALKTSSTHNTLMLSMLNVGYGIMMFASSYVEEEHQFWWWACCGWFSLLAIKSVKSSSSSQKLYLLCSAITLRIIRSWNQSGQKYAGAQDNIASWILHTPPVAPILMLLTIYFTMWDIKRTSLHQTNFFTSCAVFPAALSTSAFKTTFALADNPEAFGDWLSFFKRFFDASPYGSLVFQARVTFSSILLLAVYVSIARIFAASSRKTSFIAQIHPLLTLFLIVQTRLANIPLLLLFTLMFKLMQRLDIDADGISISTLVLSYFSYFALGGTNAISSVDLSSAYNGISNFSVVAVGVLTFVGNFAGPVFWSTAGVALLLERRHRLLVEPTRDSKDAHENGKEVHSASQVKTAVEQASWVNHMTILTLFTSTSTLAVLLACFILRQHLFVWTVFSPKFLYAVAWTLGVGVGVHGLLGGFFVLVN